MENTKKEKGKEMNIINAVKTGKYFRKKSEIEELGKDFWFSPIDLKLLGINLSKQDILSDDWEVRDDDKKEG